MDNDYSNLISTQIYKKRFELAREIFIKECRTNVETIKDTILQVSATIIHLRFVKIGSSTHRIDITLEREPKDKSYFTYVLSFYTEKELDRSINFYKDCIVKDILPMIK